MSSKIKKELIKTKDVSKYSDNLDLSSIISIEDGWESFRRMIADMKIKRLSDKKAIVWEADGKRISSIECLKGNYEGLLYSFRMLDEGDWIMGLDYADIRKSLFNEYYNEKWKDRSVPNDSFEYYYMEWRNISGNGNIEVIENEIKNALDRKNKKILNMASVLCGDFNGSVFRRYSEILRLSEGDETGWGQGCLQKNIPLSLHVFLWCK
ncbi:MAG: hypothetical protein K6G75_10430 [Lachnospiraceae bacterium]|nr:hypothetical protein [Lachnospiraceae bacterium]